MKTSQGARDFIDDDHLISLIDAPQPDRALVKDTIARSLAKQPLTVKETAVLLRAQDPELVDEIFQAARELKEKVYGNRIVLFAPLYIGNRCVNRCSYCGFRSDNRLAVRRTLTPDEVRDQVIALEAAGHKQLILVFGEHPCYDAPFIAEQVRTVYATRNGHGEIRRLNINAAPMDHEGYRIIKAAGIGTYQVFQETYSHAAYARAHPGHTRKGDYLCRLDALSRALEAGCDDVGIGVLFGLYDWLFEVLGLVAHAVDLRSRHGVGPHTISFPRLRPACGAAIDRTFAVSDEQFKRVIAILRLAVPYTGLILTAREDARLCRELMAFGVSQIDAGSRIEIGGYIEAGEYTGIDLDFVHQQGHDFPRDLSPFKLVIHCGVCMLNRREVVSRILRCREAGVPITNYGVAIAYALGVLDRALSPFQMDLSPACGRKAPEYLRQSALIFSTSFGTPLAVSSSPSYSADMKSFSRLSRKSTRPGRGRAAG